MQNDNYNLETLVLGEAPVQRSSATPLRILAFTCTKGRPFFLRCCALQIQQQTYAVDHAIYVNHPDVKYAADQYNYISLLQDLAPQQGTITIRYGQSGTQHFNYLQALHLAAHDDYDLFVKIDDDDVYRRNYVRGVAVDYQANAWDFSGTYSKGLIDGDKWENKSLVTNLGMQPEDIKLGIKEMMPSSFALNRKALNIIREIPVNIDQNEDILWRRKLTLEKNIRIHLREFSGMAYHLHGKNVSTWDSHGNIL